ncbi:MAG: universal stress protein, partial [Chloroflexi bacterium]|nr:universal stress protein [Chloroflexota bacterium]
CQEKGLPGEFAVEASLNPAEAILKRAAWADSVIINLTHPPDGKPITRLKPGLKLLLQKCPRPIHIFPDGADSDLSNMLLAYDGTLKAEEALFVATYLTGRWKKSLTVVAVETPHTGNHTLERARKYLVQYGLTDVNYVLKKGPIVEGVLETAESCNCNFLIMGGTSYRPLRHLVQGSTAANILRKYRHPMLICQ